MVTLPPSAPRPVVELVNVMRSAIVTGTLHPAQRLVEADLARLFGATRGSVRHALVLLEGEGLVEREFRRGARVRAITLQQAIEVIEARAALESLCAGKAALRATKAERKTLVELGGEMIRAVAADDLVGYSLLVQQAHRSIQRSARQDTVDEMLGRLDYQNVWHHLSVAMLARHPKDDACEHIRVIDAIDSGSASAAERLMRDHFREVIGVGRTRRAARVSAAALNLSTTWVVSER